MKRVCGSAWERAGSLGEAACDRDSHAGATNRFTEDEVTCRFVTDRTAATSHVENGAENGAENGSRIRTTRLRAQVRDSIAILKLSKTRAIDAITRNHRNRPETGHFRAAA